MSRPIPVEELLTHSGWLRRLAASLVSDPATADDLVQETWIAALRRPPAAEPRPWLARVARNLARNRQRAEARRVEHEELARAEPPAASPDALVQEAELQRLLAEAVTKLEPPLRAVVVLRYFRGLDSAVIARELGVPASTVRTRLQRALEELRAELDRRHAGERSAWSLVLTTFLRGTDGGASAQLAAQSVPAWQPWSAAGWLAGLGGAALVLAVGTIAWRRVERGERAAGGDSRVTSAAAARVQDELAVAGSARTALAATDGSSSGVRTADAEPAEIELAGRILVDGRTPEWPIELDLEPLEPAGWKAWSALMRGRPQHLEVPREQHGAFRFGPLPASWSGRLAVTQFTFDDGRSSISLAAPAADLVLRLRSGPALTARFLDPAGAPLAGGNVVFELRHEERDIAYRAVECDRDGRIRVPTLPDYRTAAATLLVEADERGYLRFETPAFVPAEGHDAGDLVLESVGTLEVRVLGRDGNPLAGAFARVDGPAWSRRSEPTDEHGLGALRFVPARSVALRLSAFRYADHIVTVGPGDFERTLEVALEPLSTLEVQLVAPAGAREEHGDLVLTAQGSLFVWDDVDWGAPVELQFELGATQGHTRRWKTDAEGRGSWSQVAIVPQADDHYLLVGLRPDVPFELDVQDAAGRSLAVRSATVAAHEWQRLEIPLAR